MRVFRVKFLREIPQWWIFSVRTYSLLGEKREGVVFSRPLLGGRQRPKIHQSGISRNRLTLKSSHVPPASAVVAADWLRLDGSMET